MKAMSLLALFTLINASHADTLRVPSTLPMSNAVRMNSTTVPVVPLPAPPVNSTTTESSLPLREHITTRPALDRQEYTGKTMYAGPVEQQLAKLRQRVDELERRLAQSEKRLAEHRHTYTTHGVNQINYRTLRVLLLNAEERDGLLSFPGGTSYRETGAPVMP
ncbi:MAG: hypothetical protein LDL19_04140 [Thiobacillus sp.]|nr:hypothetical protein [Thiobacillus sp.]